MARPKCQRRINWAPQAVYFKPRGIPLTLLEEVELELDELEALRLADYQKLYQDQAATKMGVSRATFGRIVEQARLKISDALVNGKALRINGGESVMVQTREFVCSECKHTWQLPYGTGRPEQCPECKGTNIHRTDRNRGGPGDGHRRVRHRACRGGTDAGD